MSGVSLGNLLLIQSGNSDEVHISSLKCPLEASRIWPPPAFQISLLTQQTRALGLSPRAPRNDSEGREGGRAGGKQMSADVLGP